MSKTLKYSKILFPLVSFTISFTDFKNKVINWEIKYKISNYLVCSQLQRIVQYLLEIGWIVDLLETKLNSFNKNKIFQIKKLYKKINYIFVNFITKT